MKRKLGAILLMVALVLALAVPAAVVGADPGPGIVGLWHLDESSGTNASDSSGNSNDGTLTNMNTPSCWVSGMFGNALSFDGVDDYVSIANESNFDFDWDDAFTIEAWVKTSSDEILNIVSKMDNESPNTGYQLIKHRNVQYDPSGDNKLYFFLIDTYNSDMIVVYGSTDITDGSYHHVVVTYDGTGTDSGVQIYVDGSPETMYTRGSWNSLSGADSILNNLPLQISGREGSNYVFDGKIDEVRIWDTEFPDYTVDIDIKPGSDPNSINPKSKGLIPVAILGSDTFDVTDVDVETLLFGPDEATPAHDLTDPLVYAEHLQDVNGDGFTDLVSHYRTQATGIAQGDDEAMLTGTTTYGMPITGSDSVKIVGKP